ncbi:hypothetical protein [Vibrio phage VEN]|uniref:Internal virion protein B n=1 Tax=Vibrio phage VEN TaxID=2059879 RepID=A0A2H5BMW6_9CAUD|nr:internal virion protein [Vibrio phage VEN]AUG87670.1 hypothetical protein [Vibrio phage VEN]
MAVTAAAAGTTAATSAATTMAAVTAAISIASTAYSFMQANSNANAIEKAQANKNKQLQEQTVANYAELADVEKEQQQLALDESLDVQRSYLRDKSLVNVTAAAMGTGGVSVANQLQDLEKTKYSNYNTILLNRQANMDNIKSQAESLRFQTASQMDVSPVKRPSFAAAALSAGSQALQGYSNYQTIRKEESMLDSVGSISSGG